MPQPHRLKPHEIQTPTLSADTDPQAEAVQLKIYREMATSRKIELVFEAIEMNRSLVLAGIQSRYPKAGPEEVRRRFMGLSLGEDLAARVYGPLEATWTDSEHG